MLLQEKPYNLSENSSIQQQQKQQNKFYWLIKLMQQNVNERWIDNIMLIASFLVCRIYFIFLFLRLEKNSENLLLLIYRLQMILFYTVNSFLRWFPNEKTEKITTTNFIVIFYFSYFMNL